MTSKAILRFNLYQMLRSPNVFFKHPFFLKLSAQIFTTNKIVSYFIAIVLNVNQRMVKQFYCSSGTVKVFTEDYIYKIGMWNGSLKNEYVNTDFIRTNFPEIAFYLPPIEYSNRFLFHTIKMKRYLVPMGPQSLDYANKILNEFSKYAVKRECCITEFPHIVQGMKLAKILYKSIDLETKIKEIFSVPWEVGPVHGDFHMGNILINDHLSAFMIDLDNFNLKGIQALDAFTFWIDYKTKKTKMTWQDAIRSIIKTEEKNIKSVAFLYVLNRLGYENFYYGFLSRSVEKEFRLIEELK